MDPGDFFNYAGMPVHTYRYYVAYLKGSIGLERYSREEVSQRVLQRQAQDYTEDCRGGEDRSKIRIRKYERKDEKEQRGKRNDREDVADQRRRFKSAPKTKDEPKNQRVEGTHHEVSKNRERDQAQHAHNGVGPRCQAHLGLEQFPDSMIEFEDQVDRQNRDRRGYREEYDLVLLEGPVHVVI